MKRKISFILALSLALTLFTGCNSANINDDIITAEPIVSSEYFTEDEIIDVQTDLAETSAQTEIFDEVTAETEVLTNGVAETEIFTEEVTEKIAPSVNIDNINATLKWKETKIKETYVVNQACYSRKYPIVGSATVNKYKKGTKVNTIAATDTGYYKLADGEFIHSDYLTEVTAGTTAKTTTAAATSKSTKTTTTAKTTADDNDTAAGSKVKGVIKTTYNVDYTTRYAYKTLNASEKKFYGNLVNAISNLKSTCSVPDDLLTNDMIKVYTLVLTQEPQLFWMSSKFTPGYGTCRLEYLMTDVKTIQAAQNKIDAQAAKVMAKVDAASGTYNKIKVIHDFIVFASEFEMTGDGFGSCIYNTMLGKGGTQCNGYAKTFQYLADLAGLDSVVLTGVSPQGNSHAWNKVYCEDGYYNVDCTWDDPINSHDSNYIRYVFFMVPDSWIKDSHLQPCTITRSNGTIVDLYTSPKATKTTYNYFNVTSKTYSSLSAAEKALYAEFDAAIKAGKNTAYVRVSDKTIYDKLMSDTYGKTFQKYCKEKGVKSVARQKTNMAGTLVVQYDIFYK